MKIIAGARRGYSTSETTSLVPLGKKRGDSTSTTKIAIGGFWCPQRHYTGQVKSKTKDALPHMVH
jgi:hypothetical protein